MTETAMKTRKAKLFIISKVEDVNGSPSYRIPLVPTSRDFRDVPEFTLSTREMTGNPEKDGQALANKALEGVSYVLDQRNPKIRDAKVKFDYNDDTIIVAVTLPPHWSDVRLTNHIYSIGWDTVDNVRNGRSDKWRIAPELGSELDSVYSTYDSF